MVRKRESCLGWIRERQIDHRLILPPPRFEREGERIAISTLPQPRREVPRLHRCERKSSLLVLVASEYSSI
jgi:hypothetical protein